MCPWQTHPARLTKTHRRRPLPASLQALTAPEKTGAVWNRSLAGRPGCPTAATRLVAMQPPAANPPARSSEHWSPLREAVLTRRRSCPRPCRVPSGMSSRIPQARVWQMRCPPSPVDITPTAPRFQPVAPAIRNTAIHPGDRGATTAANIRKRAPVRHRATPTDRVPATIRQPPCCWGVLKESGVTDRPHPHGRAAAIGSRLDLLPCGTALDSRRLSGEWRLGTTLGRKRAGV